MIDVKFLQNSFDEVSQKLKRRGLDTNLLEKVKEISLDLKEIKKEFENSRAMQNSLSKEFGMYKKEKKDTTELQEKLSKNKDDISKYQNSMRDLEIQLDNVVMNIPNLPDDSVPDGKDENDNVEIKKVLTPREFNFEPKAHFELGENLKWLDFEKGVKLAKSRFTVLSSSAAKMERALINYMIDFNSQRGFREVWLPAIVNRTSMTATGQLPKFEEDLFMVEKGEEPSNDLFLIPTAEVPLVNLFRDEIIAKEELPIKLTAFTPCFRKEAGSAGRDTRGMIRQHQFDKVELVVIAEPKDSDVIHQEMIDCASELLTSLQLPHRLIRLCTGDMGFGAANTVDIEVWLPSEKRYREISSVSNVRDFQARRAMIRYKDEKKNSLVHTLNGSSLAVGRTLIAIMENFQDENGDIQIPQVLLPYIK